MPRSVPFEHCMGPVNNKLGINIIPTLSKMLFVSTSEGRRSQPPSYH